LPSPGLSLVERDNFVTNGLEAAGSGAKSLAKGTINLGEEAVEGVGDVAGHALKAGGTLAKEGVVATAKLGESAVKNTAELAEHGIHAVGKGAKKIFNSLTGHKTPKTPSNAALVGAAAAAGEGAAVVGASAAGLNGKS